MRQNRSVRASTCRSAGSGGPPRRPFIKGSSDEISWIDEAQESHDSTWNSIPEASSSGRSAQEESLQLRAIGTSGRGNHDRTLPPDTTGKPAIQSNRSDRA